MFCTQCGTQIDPEKKFCKACGARLEQGAGAARAAASPEPDDAPDEILAPSPAPSRREASRNLPDEAPVEAGSGKRNLFLAAGVAVLLLAGAGIYFGRGTSTPVVDPPPAAPVPQSPAKAPDSDPLPSFESKESLPAEVPQAAQTEPPAADPPPRVEPAKPAVVEAPRRTVPPPQAQRPAQEPPRASRPAAAPASRAAATAGVYETLRSTAVHEDPSSSARVVATIPPGVRVNVVGSTGDWLEVHSRRGNPPGFIRRGDAAFVETAR